MDPNTEIKLFISRRARVPMEELSSNTLISGSGLLRSLVVLEMIAHLEEMFQIELSTEDLKEENFSSVGALSQLINGYLESNDDGASNRSEA